MPPSPSVVCTMVLCCATALALPVPESPEVAIEPGRPPGEGEACYWVVAADADGRLTTVSRPLHITRLPDRVSADRWAIVHPKPLAGASKLYVLRTAPFVEPAPVKIEVAAAGATTYYYWIVVCNGFRRSRAYGPYVARNCGDPKGNTIAWTSVPNASWYHVYRTDRPEPPVGRGYLAVGQIVGVDKRIHPGGIGSGHRETKVVDRGRLAYAVAGYPATPVTEPPLGEGLFRVGEAKGGEVRDIGQPLGMFLVPNVNETERRPLTTPAEAQSSIRSYGFAELKTRTDLPHLARPSFINHHSAIKIDQVLDGGGHSEYHHAQGSVGWKSTAFSVEAHQTSHWASQHANMGGYQRSYGSGDVIWFSPHTTVYGHNDDGGDEGSFSVRAQMVRALQEVDDTLTRDTPRGGTRLAGSRRWGGDHDPAGSGRLVVNLSQAHTEGRIVRVGNCDVRGKGTAWTPAMAGRWISFDVDTVKGHRMWYPIREVKSPAELVIRARTGWSDACNLGYSRFIYDPAETDHPSPVYTNSHACRHLPPEHRGAARVGAYVICPGALLDNQWHDGRDLVVEPLREPWRKGDRIQIAPGPQSYFYMARFMIFGDYLPQDDVGGIQIGNYGNRMTNWAAIQIGHPGHENFVEGVRMTLPKNGRGDGVVVSAATGWDQRGLAAGSSGAWRGAFVAPVNLPALRDEFRSAPYLAFHRAGQDASKSTLEARAPDNSLLAEFARDGVRVAKRLAVDGPIRGSSRTRGKAVFSGDGKATRFTIRFVKSFAIEPFVTISTNQFAASRLAAVVADRVTVEFQTPPAAGKDNVVIYWMAQE